jgi:hypothetical protein
MSQTASARTKTRRTLSPNAVGLVVVTAAIIGTLVYPGVANLDPHLLQALS